VSVRFVLGKVAGAIGTLAFVLVFNFFLFRVVDDNPVDNLFRGRNLSASQIASLERRFGVGDSMVVQFGKYVRQTLRGDLGISIKSSRPVADVIADAFWPTVWLVGTATVLSMVIGTLLGISAAWKRGQATDTAATTFSMVTYSMPDFWLAMVLFAVFAATLGWFPTGGFTTAGSTDGGLALFLDHAHHMVLPALTLVLAYLGEYMILMRAAMLDTVREDYLTLARAKGLRDVLVRRRHAVPNALLPLVSLSALNFGYVLSGAIAVEAIYSWPGLGRATYSALEGPDYPVLQGLFLLFSAAVIVASLAADLLYGFLDPRVRTS
jgi:peptide/nickel transport system permease protein